MRRAEHVKKFGVLLIGDRSAPVQQQAERLRSASISAWTATTDFEVSWLLQRAAVSSSVALVDLRNLSSNRPSEVQRFTALASVALLPLVLVGANDEEAEMFGSLSARLPRSANDADVIEAIGAILDLS